MTPKLPLPHFTFSLSPILHHPILLAAPAILLLMFLASVWRTARALFGLAAVAGTIYGLYRLAKAVNHAVKRKGAGLFTMPTLTNGTKVGSIKVMQVHSALNAGLIVVLAVVVLAFVLFGLLSKASGFPVGYVLNRIWVFFTRPIYRGGSGAVYQFPNAEIGVGIGEAEPGLPDEGNRSGKVVTIDANDRFLNMGIIGPIGSGKTFMTMKPMIYQDLEAIAQGTRGNMIWMSPQPEPSLEKYAETLGIKVRRIHIIDGQVGNGIGTNIRFNPLSSNDIDAVIGNVNILLNEQTGDKGRGDAFFDTMAAQATTDSLQLYKYLHGFDQEGKSVEIDMIGWYDNYLVQMDELFYEAYRVQVVADLEENKKKQQIPIHDERIIWLRDTLWPKLQESERIMLKRAAASIINEFGGDVSGKNAEAYKNIIRGLRGKVRVLISSQYVQELLGSDIERAKDRPNFSFESWIDPPEWIPPKVENPYPSDGGWFSRWTSKRKYKKYAAEKLREWQENAPNGHKGELLSVITGQQDVGKLVGRMVLVFLQQAVLNRPGKDNDKPPVYSFIDEYASYATKSINEIRTQGRKHCHSMVMAMQARAQMEEVSRGYLQTMEGSTRHWVYLSNLGLDDALQVAKLCGKVRRMRTDVSARQVRLGGLGKDDGSPLVTKQQKEELVDRFSAEYIRYKLGANEVIYVGVKNRQGQSPLRMRITEPRENQALIRKVNNTVDKPKKQKRKVEPKIPVYPDKKLVAKVKWPLLTFGDKTLYVYRWGMSISKDMYGETNPVDFSDPPQASKPLLLQDVIGAEFFEEVPKAKNEAVPQDTEQTMEASDDPLKQKQKQRLNNLFSKTKLCKNDGTPMTIHKDKYGGIGYKCPYCGGTVPRKEKDETAQA